MKMSKNVEWKTGAGQQVKVVVEASRKLIADTHQSDWLGEIEGRTMVSDEVTYTAYLDGKLLAIGEPKPVKNPGVVACIDKLGITQMNFDRLVTARREALDEATTDDIREYNARQTAASLEAEEDERRHNRVLRAMGE